MSSRLATLDDALPAESDSGSSRAETLRRYRELVRETTPALFRLVVRLLAQVHDAEDALQETYLRAFAVGRVEQFEDRSQVQTWLYRIATNVALDMLKRRRVSQRALPAEASESLDGLQRATALVELRELSEHLDALSDDQRAAFVLKELEGLSSARAAEVLGCSEGAVEQRLVRARALLRERCGRG